MKRALVSLMALVVLGLPKHGDTSTATSAAQPEPTTRAVAFKTGLRFERNVGQADPRVQFLARGIGFRLFLSGAEAVISLHRLGDAPEGAVVRLRLEGARQDLDVVGVDELPGKSHYFMGADRTSWRTGVSQYARAELYKVYPGIDLAYYGTGGLIEYDFVVSPGAEPERIRVRVEGANEMSLDDGGDLVLSLDGGDIIHRAPVLYQVVGGERRSIEGRFVVHGSQIFGFEVGEYDREHPLVIDPVLTYSSFFGGHGDDLGVDVAVDPTGHIYVGGFTSSLDLPTEDPIQLLSQGASEVFVAKLDPTGTSLIYSTYLGGTSNDRGLGLAIDADGYAYIAGDTSSADFPTLNAIQDTLSGFYDAFVAKIDPSGSALVYSTYLGGAGVDTADGIASDPEGSAYITGRTTSDDFPLVNAVQEDHRGGSNDAFVAKIDASGATLVYSTYLGGESNDHGNAIAVDSSGHAYVAGDTTSDDFPTVNPLQPSPHQGAFISKLDPSGSALVFSTYFGSGANEAAHGIAVDPENNVYVVGYTSSSNTPVVNPLQPDYGGGYADAFVAKLGPAGSTLVYSTFLGGGDADGARDVAADNAGNAYVVGSTRSVDFPIEDPVQYRHGGGDDAFAAKIDPTGSALVFSTLLGGSLAEVGLSAAVSEEWGFYVTGSTASPDFPTTSDAFRGSYRGGYTDAFVVRFSDDLGEADLAIEKTNGLSQVLPGQLVTYTIEVTNDGPNPAHEVAITDDLPESLVDVSWACEASPGSTCLVPGGAGDVAGLVNIDVGGVVSLTVNAKLDSEARGTLTNIATVTPSATLVDPDLENNTAIDEDDIIPVATVDLEVNGQDAVFPDFVTVSGNVQLTLDMTAGLRSLDHYFYVWSDGTLYWYTASGMSTSPAPLVTFRPAEIEDLVLLDATLPPGSYAFGWVMLDGDAFVHWEQISVLVTP